MTISDVLKAAGTNRYFVDWLHFELVHECSMKLGQIVNENDPDDPGGLTFAGVDKANHKWFPYDNPTPADVVKSYRADWNAVRGDDLPPLVSIVIANFAVNMGVHPAVELLQHAVGVNPDGDFGPMTLQAVKNVTNPLQVAMKVIDLADARYATLHGAWKYLRGWLNRDNDIRVFDKQEALVA